MIYPITLLVLFASHFSTTVVMAAPVPVGKPEMPSPSHSMAEVCTGGSNLEAHWAGVEKNDAGRVTQEAFIKYFTKTAFAEAIPENLKSVYVTYLRNIFATGREMVSTDTATYESGTLGRHCFRSVATLPFEFYKDGSSGGYCELFH